MTKQEIIMALSPVVREELLNAIKAVFDREEVLSKAASMFNAALMANDNAPKREDEGLSDLIGSMKIDKRLAQPYTTAAQIENSIDAMRSRPKYMHTEDN